MDNVAHLLAFITTHGVSMFWYQEGLCADVLCDLGQKRMLQMFKTKLDGALSSLV